MSVISDSENKEKSIRKNLAEVFNDTESHLKVAKIIRDHLINFQDIRSLALKGVNFTNVRKILDLGCGFGYFTRGLKGKVHPDAVITGIDCHSRYKQLYLDACSDIGIQGNFMSEGISVINSFKPKSVDLILCSYALYFFPEYIEQISRMVKDDGTFVVITHAQPHMKEFTQYVKDILYNEGFDCREPLPYESLIEGFSNENGEALLSAGFSDIYSINYKGRLLFNHKDIESFRAYFKFKRSFFIPCKETDIDDMSAIILERMKNDLLRFKKFE
ncbi:MAG: methyltransferase domain-containing protein, partial [Bacteroidales bacterium]|nr:methyltransferase domain-containing protein [Bacteroidales bacterium]